MSQFPPDHREFGLFRTDVGSRPTQIGRRPVAALADSSNHVDLLLTVDATDTATIIGHDFPEFTSPTRTSIFDLVELGYRSRMRRLLGKCRQSRETQRDVFELRGLPETHLVLVARPGKGDRDNICISGCDVTEVVSRQKEAEQQASLLEQVLAVAPNHIFWKDKELRFLGGNNNFVTALGLESIDDLVGKSDYDFFPADEADSSRAVDAEVMQSGQSILNLEERQTREDGTEGILLTSKVPFRNPEGEIIGLLGVFEEVTDRKAMEEKLVRRATRDDLTGLPNRRALVEHINQALQSHNEQCASLLFIDMDRFKIVNDSLGHAVGDELVMAIASRLKDLLEFDRNHFIARLGGDEFAILLHPAVPEEAVSFAERILDAMSKAFWIDDIEIYSSASMGIVHVTDRYQSANEVLRDADIAMYRAKAAGKSRYQLFDLNMYFEATREMTRHNEVRRAVDSMEFELHYQPIVHLGEQRCTGFEALIRWTPPEGQPVPPALFMPFLEETGLIIRVGEWVIDEACRQLRAWQDAFPNLAALNIAVNLSRIQFKSHRLTQTIAETIEKYGIPPGQLIAEITESTVSDNPQQTFGKLRELRGLGVRVAMDDFGVGHSALGKLDRTPIDILKIDRSFVDRIGYNESEPLVEAILQMTRTLGLATIGEGVEHYHQAQWLQQHGCHEAQGYFFARPFAPQEGIHPFEYLNLPGI